MTTANPSKYNGSASNAIPSSIENMENEIQRLQSLNKELEAALRKCQAFLNEWRDCLAGVQMTEADFDNTSGLLEASSALARAESATPKGGDK